MGHSYAQRCTVYKNWNLRFCLETHHHQKIKTPAPKQKKQHCNINDTTPSYHPLIIINITAPSPHITETSPKRARDVANDQRITERSPKHHPKTNKATPKQQLDITKKRQRQDRDTTERRPRHDWDITETSPKQHRDITEPTQRQDDITETSPKQHRDIIQKRQRHDRDLTEVSPRHHQNNTETSPRHHQNNTETWPRQDRDNTKTTPRHHQKRQRQGRDTTETSPRQDRDILGDFFSGACAAPGRLIHVRPQAYRYWGNTREVPIFVGGRQFQYILQWLGSARPRQKSLSLLCRWMLMNRNICRPWFGCMPKGFLEACLVWQ